MLQKLTLIIAEMEAGNTSLQMQTFQPLSHANLEVLKTSPEKPGDWDLKPGDFQNMCQIIKKALFV